MLLAQLRNELFKLFGKKRTYIGSGMFLLAQCIVMILLRFLKGPHERLIRDIERTGYPADQYLSNWTISTIVLVVVAMLLLPLYVALVGGDLVAKEAEDGTLRMILCRPVSRLRLLLLKWAAGAIFSVALVISVGLFGAISTRFFFPSGGLFVLIPEAGVFSVFDGGDVWWRYSLAHLVLSVKAITIMSLAFMFSCFNVKPASATILAISFIFISMILQQIPYFHDLQNWFLTYHLNFWAYFFRPILPWPQIIQSVSFLVGYNLTFLVIGCTAFQMRDIKS